MNEDRLAVLGQIAVMHNRLERLEQILLDMPLGPRNFVGPEEADAIGNISLQAGVLVGLLTKYQDNKSNVKD
jgi:hypothetical protein